ncbi:MAG TPA: DUF5309 family protein [Limnochordia bacterium]
MTTDAEFSWFEDDIPPRTDRINNASGYTAGDTALVVDNAPFFRVDDLVKVTRTGEVMRVTAVDDGTNTVTVVRGYGTTPAAALVDNDELLIIGNAHEENADLPEANMPQVTKVRNFTQIFREPVEISRTLRNTRLRGPGEQTRQRRLAGIAHAVDIERAFLFGEPKEDLSSGKPRRATGGLLHFLTANVLDAGGTLTETEWEQWLEEVFRFDKSPKVLFASARLATVLNQFATGKIRIMQPSQRTYGLAVMEYLSIHGRLRIIEHQLLTGDEYGGYGILVTMSNIRARPLQDSDTTLRRNVGDPGRDGFADEFLTEIGLEVRLPQTHGVIKNVTG